MNKIKNILVGIGIAIIIPMFLIYGMDTFYPMPEYSDYCEGFERMVSPDKNQTAENCAEASGKWTNNFCDYTFECMQEYDSARESHGRVSFVILILLGLAAIISGVFLKSLSAASGLMAGGIITVIFTSMMFWRYVQGYVRIIFLGLVLVVLFVIAYNKSKK
jgi:hypothetical protein